MFINSTTTYCGKVILNGVSIGEKSSLVGDEIELNGKEIDTISVTIQCKKLSGKGLIEGGKITIIADEFFYTGTIKCDEECVIITKNSVDQKKIIRQGKGKLSFVIKE